VAAFSDGIERNSSFPATLATSPVWLGSLDLDEGDSEARTSLTRCMTLSRQVSKKARAAD